MAGGRPPKYNAEKHCRMAEVAARLGGTDSDIAEACGISRSTFYKWSKDHPEFSDSVKEGKSLSDELVKRRLYARAIGYEHKAVKIFMPAGADKPVFAEYREHYPPDVGAAVNWLVNRTDWKNKNTVEHDATPELVEKIRAARKRANDKPGND